LTTFDYSTLSPLSQGKTVVKYNQMFAYRPGIRSPPSVQNADFKIIFPKTPYQKAIFRAYSERLKR
jgi:hypothetical protein